MEFNPNKSIYLQVYDNVCHKILIGELLPDERIPSVREYATEIGVNPNTIMRTYEKLTSDNIIYNKRGIGYFVSPNAKEEILEFQRNDFLTNELPGIIARMKILGISKDLIIRSSEEEDA